MPELDDTSIWSGPKLLDWFMGLSWGDLWKDADMIDVLDYLYGNHNLMAPPAWKEAVKPF